MTDKRPTIEELIERSSLGTPDAVAARATVPIEVARAVVERAMALRAEDASLYGTWPGDGDA